MKMLVTFFVFPAIIAALSMSSALAQQRQGIKTVPLITQPVTGAADKEMTILSIELDPGGASGLHTHPGDEHGTVVEGTLMVKVGNGDYTPIAVGQTFSSPPNTPMEIRNNTDKPVKVINVLILDKGKPRTMAVH